MTTSSLPRVETIDEIYGISRLADFFWDRLKNGMPYYKAMAKHYPEGFRPVLSREPAGNTETSAGEL